jgi:hypothetical protein
VRPLPLCVWWIVRACVRVCGLCVCVRLAVQPQLTKHGLNTRGIFGRPNQASLKVGKSTIKEFSLKLGNFHS